MKPPRESAETGIPMAIVFSLLTCGIYALYWQSKIFDTTNALIEREKYSFWPWFLLSLVTCGIYNIYTQYQLGESLNEGLMKEGRPANTNLSVLGLVLSLFGLQIVVHAIDQAEINKLYE